jgi:hypothetical protein
VTTNKAKARLPITQDKHIPAYTATEQAAALKIPYPLLWLGLAAVLVYCSSCYFGLTELDDSIFIRDFHAYNEDLAHLFTSFHRGLFDAVKDPYYRPLFMDSMILNNLAGEFGSNIGSYHVVNVLFHIIAVLLLYKLLIKLKVKELHAFLLCLLFSVHPVLSQAVAWIPGRNDTMLAIFVFSFLIFSIDYADKRKLSQLLLSALFLLLAYFTKETAVFAAPVAFVMLVFLRNKKWNERSNLVQYGVWAACFLLWFAVRASATIQTNIGIAQVAHDFIPRLPLIIQYLGKIFFPFNLSVFPIQQDTVYYYGIAALLFLAAIIALNKERNLKVIFSGLGIFLLFLLPVLFVPARLNEQAFEHRLYLPVIGILLLLPQTTLLNNRLKEKQLLAAGIGVCGLFAVINFQHQRSFEDPLTFWTKAADSSPHSAFANMMLAARLDKDDIERSGALFRKAYQLNPNEKYLNFYMGVLLQKKDSVKESEPYLLAEKNASNYYECDFYLARVAMEKKDLNGAIAYLEAYLKKDVNNSSAHNNLLLLYRDTQQPAKGRAHIIEMQQAGLKVPKEIQQQFGL